MTENLKKYQAMQNTEVAYPHYPGYVYPLLSRGISFLQIEAVLADPRVVEGLTSLLSEVLKHPLVPRAKKYNPEYYETVMDSLRRLNYIRVAMTIAATYITGRTINELLWGDLDGKVVPVKFLPRPGESLIYKWETPEEGYYPVVWARGVEHRPSDYPRQFIIAHYWAVPDSDPYGNGLAESLYQLVVAGGRAMEDWVKYNSTYAEPTRVGHYPVDAADEEIEQFNMFINKLGSARAVTVPKGFEITYINPPSNSGSSQKELYDTMTQAISLLIMGENTAGKQHTGGTATQDVVSSTLRGSRAYLLGSLIADTISSTISKWIGELNFPSEPPLELTYDKEQDPEEVPDAGVPLIHGPKDGTTRQGKPTDKH